MNRFPPLVFLLLTTFAAPALGQTIPSSYRYIENGQEVGVFTGLVDVATGRFELGPERSPSVGARYGIELGGPFSLEGTVLYLPGTRSVVDPRRDEGDRIIGDADVRLMAVDARLAFSLTGRRTWNRISPIVFLGGGLAFDVGSEGALDETLEERDRFDFGTSFTGTAGTGLRIVLTDWLQLRADLGLLIWQVETPDGFSDPDRDIPAVEEAEWVGGWTFTVGTSWRF